MTNAVQGILIEAQRQPAQLEYSWGHQADHTAKYAKGTIGVQHH